MNVKIFFVYFQKIYLNYMESLNNFQKNYFYFYTKTPFLFFLFPRFLTSELGEESSLNTADAFTN